MSLEYLKNNIKFLFQIKLEFLSNEYGAADSSNLLALPSKKRNTKIISEKQEKTRFLSKARRKQLEKIVDKKKKKENVSAKIYKYIYIYTHISYLFILPIF